MPAGTMPGPPGSGVTSPARRNRTRPISRLSPVDIPSRARLNNDIRAPAQSQMIGERRVFVSINEGVEKIADGLRNRVATFTREYSQQNARKANNHRRFLRAHNKGRVARMEPTGPARSGRPDDRLRVIRDCAVPPSMPPRISLRSIRATKRARCSAHTPR